MVLIAVLAGVFSLANFFLFANGIFPKNLAPIGSVVQLIVFLLTVFAAVGYKGRRTAYEYKGAPYKVFTLRFAVIFVSLLGSFCVLAVLILNAVGAIQGF